MLGPRRRAAAQVRQRDVDLKRGTMRFQEKGGKIVVKPMPDELVAILSAAWEYLRLPLALTACGRARDSLSFAKSKIVISACYSSMRRIPMRFGWPRSRRRISMIEPPLSDAGRG